MLIDQQLIADCRKNSRRAQFELYRKCYGVLMGVCLRYEKNHDDAESLLNMGYFKVVTKLDKYQPHIPFEAWIRRIMINTIIDEFRKTKKDREHLEYTDFADYQLNKSPSYNTADLHFDAEQLESMIRQLPPVSQKVFNLHVIDGYSHKEVADLMNISVGTSKWHVSSARKQLREMIENSRKKNSNTITV